MYVCGDLSAVYAYHTIISGLWLVVREYYIIHSGVAMHD